jgi:hypothetical protein
MLDREAQRRGLPRLLERLVRPLSKLPKTSDMFVVKDILVFSEDSGIFFSCRCDNNLICRIIVERLW